MKRESSGSCLILEATPWAAFDLADYVSFSEYELAGPFATCREVLAYLEDRMPTIAIIDIKVADGSSRLIVEKLTKKNIPFTIYSGYSRGDFTYTCFASDATWIVKPARAEAILAAAERLVSPSVCASRQLQHNVLDTQDKAATSIAEIKVASPISKRNNSQNGTARTPQQN